MYNDERETGKKYDPVHSVVIDARNRINISGVQEVESFDENNVIVFTSAGMLTISGENLHVDKLNIENGELDVEGRVDALEYSDDSPNRGSFWSRVFG
ncbi:MAG: sporulation protein YabP [Clostridiales bacterium]|nr:sporulation protein YabP [Clostridiales bacterium]